MSFSLEDIRHLLLKENLLKEFVSTRGWHLDVPEKAEFLQLSYDSRKADASTLFFCKGMNFKEEFSNRTGYSILCIRTTIRKFSSRNHRNGYP